MKVLYGVQGTGNGHLSRARLMASAFAAKSVEVDYLFSGRTPSAYFAMEVFNNPGFRQGLTFVTRNGRLSRLASLFHNRPIRFLRDVRELRVEGYDLVITDFEPVVAWSSRLSGVKTVALGHQYALDDSPVAGASRLDRWITRNFAPADEKIGLHWHPYHPELLPPMVDVNLRRLPADMPFNLVYLPFEDLRAVVQLLKRFSDHQFVVYTPTAKVSSRHKNITVNPPSVTAFKQHLQQCSRVICNAGFELISEALFLGIPVLAKPLRGQWEQASNASALAQLGLAQVMGNLDAQELAGFLEIPADKQHRIIYPNVSNAIVEHCLGPYQKCRRSLSQELWSQTSGYQLRDDLNQTPREQPVHAGIGPQADRQAIQAPPGSTMKQCVQYGVNRIG